MLKYGLPDGDLLERLLRARLGGFEVTGLDWKGCAELATGLSQAETVRAAEDAAKTAVLTGTRLIATEGLREALEDRRRASIGG